MTASLQFDPRSVAAMRNALAQLPRRVAIKHMRIGANAAVGVAKQTAIAKSPRETGTLAKSHVGKVVIPDASHSAAHHGKPVRIIVGPSRKFRRFVTEGPRGLRAITDKRAAKLGVTRIRKPSRYAHLAEKKSPAIAAAQRTLETAGMNKMHEKLSQGLAQEAAALAKN